MSPLPSAFVERFGSGQQYRAVTEDQLGPWRGKLRDDLIEALLQDGLRTYGEGLFWLVDPSEFASVADHWLTNPGTVFARTSFGNLLVADQQDRAFWLDVHRGRLDDLGVDPMNFLRFGMTKDAFVDRLFERPLHQDATRKLGPIRPDEMFTFEPALALGGAAELRYVQKATMFPQLSILAQLNAP